MANFGIAYTAACDCEFSLVPKAALEYAKGESFMTYKGVNRRDEPNFKGWKLIDKIIANSANMSDAAVACFNDKALEQITQDYLKAKYFDALRCGLMPQNVANRVFTHSLLIGDKTGAKIAQIVAGATPDGNIGDTTIKQIIAIPNFCADYDTVLNIFLTNKTIAVSSLADNRDGWQNRIKKVKNYD